ncbi:hypothetical protein ACLK17_00320 [Escherichia coli]
MAMTSIHLDPCGPCSVGAFRRRLIAKHHQHSKSDQQYGVARAIIETWAALPLQHRHHVGLLIFRRSPPLRWLTPALYPGDVHLPRSTRW